MGDIVVAAVMFPATLGGDLGELFVSHAFPA
jgi:hypothetical protein